MKRKIKIFRASNISMLEKTVNDFIADKMVTGIQLQTTLVNEDYRTDGTPVISSFYDTVMITYLEDSDD